MELSTRTEHGIFMLEGWSVGEEYHPVYRELIDKLIVYFRRNERLVLYFNLQLFDKRSLSYILKILGLLNVEFRKGRNITVKWGWTSNTSLMKATGKDLKELCDFSFELFEA